MLEKPQELFEWLVSQWEIWGIRSLFDTKAAEVAREVAFSRRMLTLKAWLGGMEGRRQEEDSAEQNIEMGP